MCGSTDLAAELTQETLLRGWENREKVRDEKLRRAWLFRIAVNTWRDHCRRESRLRLSGGVTGDESHFECRSPSPDLVAEGKELGEQIWDAIGELPQRQQQVMHLRVVERMEISEIAQLLEIDRHLVRSNLSIARATLKERFQDKIKSKDTSD